MLQVHHLPLQLVLHHVHQGQFIGQFLYEGRSEPLTQHSPTFLYSVLHFNPNSHISSNIQCCFTMLKIRRLGCTAGACKEQGLCRIFSVCIIRQSEFFLCSINVQSSREKIVPRSKNHPENHGCKFVQSTIII